MNNTDEMTLRTFFKKLWQVFKPGRNMIRTIITADKNNLTLLLPDDFLGKKIEVIAFILEEPVQEYRKKTSFTVLEVPEDVKESYRFNRDEANER